MYVVYMSRIEGVLHDACPTTHGRLGIHHAQVSTEIYLVDSILTRGNATFESPLRRRRRRETTSK